MPESSEPKFKRLKRGPREERNGETSHGVNDIFRDSDDEDEALGQMSRRGLQNEFDDFIEEDVFSDDEAEQFREDQEVARPNRTRLPDWGTAAETGLSEAALEDFRLVFGDGTDYDFALDQEDEQDQIEAAKDKALDLPDVFEPSQLAEKMLTAEDNAIRFTDEPERFQIARKPYRNVLLTEEQFREEAAWISALMLPKAKKLRPEVHEPFRQAVAKVLQFMVVEDLEVPFIFQNRKDYLIHADRKNVGRGEDGAIQYEIEASKLLQQDDLWTAFDLDLKFRGFIDKRNAIEATYQRLRDTSVASDNTFDTMLPQAQSMEDLQDLQEYLHFQYASQLKDLAASGDPGIAGFAMSRKKAATKTVYEQIRSGNLYGLVRAFGISANDFAQNALKHGGAKNYTEDPIDKPDDMADSFIDEEFPTGTSAYRAAKAMFIEELAVNPKLRRVVRENLYATGIINVCRTEKGLRKIDESHPYYEFKYLRNQEFPSIARQPDMFLRMLKAEEEGLVEVKVGMRNYDSFKKLLYRHIESDNYSEVADAWNRERREVVDAALAKIVAVVGRAAKENLKTECESSVAKDCRLEFTRRLDQAPYQPKGMKKGTIPRVLAITNGAGVLGRDPIYWAWVGEDGRVLENGKFMDLTPGDKDRSLPDGKDVGTFAEVIRRREPDVIGLSGFSPDSRKLNNQLTAIIDERDLRGAIYEDDDGRERSDLLDVVIVNDEIARLYQTSDRAKHDHPGFAPLTNYCVALAKFMQDPLKEYAALGRDLTSIVFAPGQQLLPQEHVLRVLETVLVDFVNMVGVDVNEAASDIAVANLLPYVAGLGPRKASQMLKVINLHGGIVNSRAELLGTDASQAAISVKCWNNAASTLMIDFDPSEPESEYLDNTRIHPEDYDIARKMAADALELDEEDIKAEVDENGSGAIVRKLIKDDAQERVNDLILEEYAAQLENNLNQRKRATLENIRAELIEPYEELRQPFMTSLASDVVFTMFTGETRDTLDRGMVVPISVKRITDDHIDGKLDCGVDAFVGDTEMTDDYNVPVKQLYHVHQTVQAKILSLDRKNFVATVSLREDQIKRPYRKFVDRQYDEWDDRQEAADKKLLEERTDAGGRATRVIKHPLFRPYSSKQAEEYLANQNRGDAIIRPSSKGIDHLAVTWKVSDGIFQHIDVLEMGKDNEFALGKTLKIGGKYTYSDLDELIAMHVKAMAKKVDEMMGHEKFQNGSKAEIGKALFLFCSSLY